MRLSWHGPSHSCLKFFKWCAQVCVLLNCVWASGREQRRVLSVSRGAVMCEQSPLCHSLESRQHVLGPSGWRCRPVGSGSSAGAKTQASVLSRGSPKHMRMLFLCAWQFGITSFSFKQILQALCSLWLSLNEGAYIYTQLLEFHKLTYCGTWLIKSRENL